MNNINIEYLHPKFEIVFLPNNIDLYEYLQCSSLPKDIIEAIIKHYKNMALEIGEEMKSEGFVPGLTAVLKTEKDFYRTTDVGEFSKILNENLESADDFIIYTEYTGANLLLGDTYDGPDIYDGLRDIVLNADPNTDITYKRFSTYDLQYEEMYFYTDGDRRDLKTNAQIINGETEPLHPWFNEGINLIIDFDFAQYPDVLKNLHSCVLKYTNLNNYKNCKECWEEGNSGLLLYDFQWDFDSLKKPQQFLNEVNSILNPIKDEIKIEADGGWYYMNIDVFAAAWIELEGGELQIVKAQF